MRETIYHSIMRKEMEVAEDLIAEYENCMESKKPLHQQAAIQMRAIYAYLINRDAAQCRKKLETALEITFPKWRTEIWSQFVMCTQEIRLLLTIYYLLFIEGKASADWIKALSGHIDKHFTDEEEKAKIYPQSAWLAGKAFMEKGETEKAYEMYQRGERCLSQNGVLMLMDEILKEETYCLRKQGKNKEASCVGRKREAIDFLFELTEERGVDEEILYFMQTSHQNELVISNEVIRELRLAKGLSQEELSDEICSQETLSRIEHGKRSPNRKKLQQLLERLDSERKIYQGFVVTDDYQIYEKVRESGKYWFKKNKEESDIILEEIECGLDMRITANRQYDEHRRLLKQSAEGYISAEEELEELERILRYSMKEFAGEIYREPSREEFVLLNRMALCKKRMGQVEDAILLYEQIQKYYQSSGVLECNHAMSEFIFYINYVGILETADQLEKAEKSGMDGIRLMLECQRGDMAAELLGNLACVYEKKGKKQRSEFCLRYSYQLLILYGHEKDSIAIKEYYEKKYGRKID